MQLVLEAVTCKSFILTMRKPVQICSKRIRSCLIVPLVFSFFLPSCCSGQPTEETSVFCSVPLGFYILGSMFMLIGSKYIAGQCVQRKLEQCVCLMVRECDESYLETCNVSIIE